MSDMPPSEPNLLAYRAGELLIAHLKCESPLGQDAQILLEVEKTILPKPYFAIVPSSGREYFFVGRLNAAGSDRKVVTSIYCGDTSTPLARTEKKPLIPFSEFLITPYAEGDRARLRHSFLEKLPNVLPPLDQETLGELRRAVGAAAEPGGPADSLTNPPREGSPPVIAGFFERATGGQVQGWVWNQNAPEDHLPIELWADGEMVCAGVADLPRLDLKEAGIGAGDHAFRIDLPASYHDGEPHIVWVRESLTGTRIKPGEIEYRADGSLTAWIEGVRGLAITGWVARDVPSVFGTEVMVLERGEIIAKGWADQVADVPGGARFHVPLPTFLFDGRVHHLVLRNGSGEFLGEIAEILPYIMTPEDALQRYGGSHLRGYLLNNAARRYESLRYQFDRLARDETIDPASRNRLGQIFAAHEQLIRGFPEPGRSNLAPLHFPGIENPEISVIIPVHNKFAVTYYCLASLLVSPNDAGYEVILVDDGSEDETLEIGNLITGITVLRNESAQGFVRSCNRGGKAARGRYIVMLNNDVEVGPRWLDELHRVFQENAGVGLAGAKLLYPNGTLQEAGGIVWNTGDPWNYGRGGNPHDPRYNYVRDVDYVSGACFMLPKTLWDELGGFDELFAPAYFEDTDLCFRVRDRGFRTVYTPFCEIVHFEGASNGTSTGSGTKRYQEINRPKFKKRHAAACRHNGAPGTEIEINKDRNIRHRALVIDATTPRPDQDAGSYAAVQEMRLLQALGCKLTFVPENAAYLGEHTERLQRMGVECAYGPFTLSPYDLLKQRGPEFDLVYVTRYSVADKFIDAIREFAPKARIVFNNADLHFLRELRLAIARRSPDLVAAAVKTRDAELSVMRRVDLTLSYNEVEHAVILSHNLDSTRIAKCPWVVDLPERVPGYAARRDIAFLGGYGHPPNAEAVEAFVLEVMPLLRERLPGVRFLVYGSNPPKTFDALASDDVVIKGWVKEVGEVYDTCRVFVAPLNTGAGLKGKVAGALAHGVPSVLSPIAAEGMGLRKDVDARIVVKPEAWVDAIAELYQDEGRWQACSEASRQFAAAEFGFDQGRALMAEALAMVEIY